MIFRGAHRAIRRGALILLGALLVAAATAGENRSAPTRPAAGAPPAAKSSAPARSAVPAFAYTRIEGVEHISVAEIGRRLALKGAWTNFRQNFTLTDKNTKIDLEVKRRNASINGLRLHLNNPTAVLRGTLYLSRVDFERSVLPRVRPSLVPDRPARPRVIGIDAGHGGTDSGTSNARLNLAEKELTLDIARRLRALVVAAGMTAVMTRDNDNVGVEKPEFLRRAEVVNRGGADIFISIHLNALPRDVKTGGTETFVFTPAGQWSTQAWEVKSSDAEANPVPVNRHDAWSSLLSQSVQRELLASLQTTDRGQKTKHAAILRNIDCPAILVESAFLSSDVEGQRLSQPEYRQKIAEAIFAGIRGYANALDAGATRPQAK